MLLFGLPDILCSAKRLKLLMQPLSSIHVRTEALALTKLEVWWYLLMRLGPHLPSNFEQVTQLRAALVPQPGWGVQLSPCFVPVWFVTEIQTASRNQFSLGWDLQVV